MNTVTSPGHSIDHFADRVILRARDLGHPLCLGLDPHLDRIPESFRRGSMDPADPETAEAVETFLGAILDRALHRVVAVKPQIAFFELLGWRGLRVLESLTRKVRAADVPVVLDAKRGDIGSTARAYAAACLGPEAPFLADAVTVNPFLGRDSLDPFIEVAAATRGGLFVLVKTSNPGGADLQDLPAPGGGTVSEAIAGWFDEAGEKLQGPATGWSSLGAVVGATRTSETVRLREVLPRSLFLVPGFGAQGGSASDAVCGFVAGPQGREGGLVNSSRGILFPAAGHAVDVQGWEVAVDEAISVAVDQLARVVATPGEV